MPSCYLQVYENIKNTGVDQKYWEEYTSFYEQFWGDQHLHMDYGLAMSTLHLRNHCVTICKFKRRI